MTYQTFIIVSVIVLSLIVIIHEFLRLKEDDSKEWDDELYV